MKRLRSMTQRFVTIGLVAIGVTSVSFAQVGFKLGLGGGLVSPMADYGGSTAEYYDGKNYGLSTGWNLHGKVRLNLVGFNVAGQIGYSFLSNSGTPPQGGGTVEVAHNVFTIKVGPEYHISLPASPVAIYLGANGQWNSFSGSTTFKGISGVSSGTIDLTSASRIGVGFSAGVIVRVPALPTFDIGLNYDLMNLSGKAFEQDPSKDNREESYAYLNDEKDPAYRASDSKHFIATSRSISALTITVAVMFGL
ncbi:MAG TPA: hypothetical protein VNN76_01895 [Bacteroidota bacterium]|nr:hypothetical protein [Bacteroidota bacterium]